MLDKDSMLKHIDQKLDEIEQRRNKRRKQLMSAKALSVAIGASSKMLTTGCPVAMYGIDEQVDATAYDADSDDTLAGNDLVTLYSGPMDASADVVATDANDMELGTLYAGPMDASADVVATDANDMELGTLYAGPMDASTNDTGESVDGMATMYGIQTDDAGMSVDGMVTMYGVQPDDAGLSVDGMVTMYGIQPEDAGESADGMATTMYGIQTPDAGSDDDI